MEIPPSPLHALPHIAFPALCPFPADNASLWRPIKEGKLSHFHLRSFFRVSFFQLHPWCCLSLPLYLSFFQSMYSYCISLSFTLWHVGIMSFSCEHWSHFNFFYSGPATSLNAFSDTVHSVSTEVNCSLTSSPPARMLRNGQEGGAVKVLGFVISFPRLKGLTAINYCVL